MPLKPLGDEWRLHFNPICRNMQYNNRGYKDEQVEFGRENLSWNGNN